MYSDARAALQLLDGFHLKPERTSCCTANRSARPTCYLASRHRFRGVMLVSASPPGLVCSSRRPRSPPTARVVCPQPEPEPRSEPAVDSTTALGSRKDEAPESPKASMMDAICVRDLTQP